MADVPLFKALGLSGLQAITLTSVANRGLTNVQALAEARATGLTFSNGPANAYLSYLQGKSKSQTLYNNLASGETLPVNLLTPSSFNQLDNFLYPVTVTVADAETGEETQEFQLIATADNVSSDIIKLRAQANHLSSPSRYPGDIVSIKVSAPTVRQGYIEE